MLFDYKLIRSKRKTVSIQVDLDCNITVRAPLRTSQKEIDAILLEKKEWIEKAVVSQIEKKKNVKEYSAEEIERMRRKAKSVIPDKVEYYGSIMGLKPNSIKINSAKKRYGSCSGTDNLNFSLYLMDKDERFIDYVVVHELAHIKYHNHSKEFYKLIEQYMPDYKERMKL